jgi:hypothetical protein
MRRRSALATDWSPAGKGARAPVHAIPRKKHSGDPSGARNNGVLVDSLSPLPKAGWWSHELGYWPEQLMTRLDKACLAAIGVATLACFYPIPTTVQQPDRVNAAGSASHAGRVSRNPICHCKGYAGPGGPCFAGPGGRANDGPGGPAYAGPGGPCYAGPGGPENDAPGGPAYAGPGGPMHDGPGGPMYRGPGGAANDGPGGPAYAGPGGPCNAGPGGPCYSGPGGTGEKCSQICR